MTSRPFTQATEQLPARARCLARLREHLADAVLGSGRAVEEVAAGFGVAWWTVQDAVDAAVVELPEVDTLRVRHLGVDEHDTGIQRWLDARTPAWRDRIEVVAIDPCREHRHQAHQAHRTGQPHHYQRRFLRRSHRQTRRWRTRLNQLTYSDIGI